MSTNFIGLELLLQIVKQDIKKKEDVIVCAAHSKIVSSGFLCIGVGNSSNGDVTPTAHLPDGWGSQTDGYLLRYRRNDEMFLLNVREVDGVLLLNLMRKSDGRVWSTSVEVESHVSSDFKTSPSPLQKDEELSTRIQTELIRPIIEESGTGPSVTINPGPSQNPPLPQQPQRNQQDPLMIGGPRIPQSIPFVDPLNIGHNDLHPFGIGPGGGMLLPGPGHHNPAAGIPGNLPRGAVPPGARFDPFGPPNPDVQPPGFLPPGPPPPGRGRGGFGGPDPDHLPPPPGYDDMFM